MYTAQVGLLAWLATQGRHIGSVLLKRQRSIDLLRHGSVRILRCIPTKHALDPLTFFPICPVIFTFYVIFFFKL